MSRVPFDLDDDVRPVSDFRANSAALLERVKETRRPLLLTQRGRSAAVLVDVASYQALVDELDELRDVQRGLADAEAGRVVPHAEAQARLLDRYRR